MPPGLATVSMSAEAASETGIESYHFEIDAEASAGRLFDRVAELDAPPTSTASLVQLPVRDHVASRRVLRRIDPVEDVDGFHPADSSRGTPDTNFATCLQSGAEVELP